MTLDRRQGRWASSIRRRVNWLRRNPALWDKHVDAHVLVYAMKREGLIAKSTYWKDVNVDALCLLAARQMEKR